MNSIPSGVQPHSRGALFPWIAAVVERDGYYHPLVIEPNGREHHSDLPFRNASSAYRTAVNIAAQLKEYA